MLERSLPRLLHETGDRRSDALSGVLFERPDLPLEHLNGLLHLAFGLGVVALGVGEDHLDFHVLLNPLLENPHGPFLIALHRQSLVPEHFHELFAFLHDLV